jgi:N-acetylneuraminic acid mutarotase
MSVLTPKRVFLVVVVFLLGAASAFANNPSPRYLARMVFDESTGNTVLFGGRADINVDGATGVIHSIDETWLLNGTRWSQRFPDVRPSARASHGMIYDSKRARVVLFGGFTDSSVANGLPAFHNDLWSYKDGQWTIIDTVTAPKPRYDAGMAYDSDRDRIVLFGGIAYQADNKTTENLFDTWEFDGTNWTEVVSHANGPKLEKGTLEYDPSRKQMLLVGINEAGAPAMYIQNPQTSAWAAPSPAPEKLPTCTNEGVMAYQRHSKKIAFVGGICTAGTTTTPASDEVWEWDGATWVKATTNSVDRVTGPAFTYDSTNFRLVMFGGVTYGSTFPRSTVQTYLNGTWSFNLITYRPRPRSLGAFQTDTSRGAMWLFGGLNEYGTGYTADFWRNDGSNQWTPITVEGGGAPPVGCVTPSSAYDSTRARFVLSCYGSELFEWDGATWKAFTDLSKEPVSRRFFSMAYDEKLKKVILFGGYDDATGNFRQDTWTWDGTVWAEVKNQRPPHRSLTSMWYDPNLQKVVIYGGVGRSNLDQKAVRFEDMWAFDGNGWTQLNVTTTPGPRLGAQVAVNPVTRKLLLFGGLRAEQNEDNTTKQWYDSDTWEWDGAASSWTKLAPATSPDARENGLMTWDPVRQMITMFGGFKGGYYLSDVWTWNGTTWVPYIAPLSRSRATGR